MGAAGRSFETGGRGGSGGMAKRSKFGARFRVYFFAGILVTAPLGITLWLAWRAVGFVDDRVRPLIPAEWHPETYLPFELPGFGILVVLIFVGKYPEIEVGAGHSLLRIHT